MCLLKTQFFFFFFTKQDLGTKGSCQSGQERVPCLEEKNPPYSCVSQAHAVHIYKCLLLTLQKEWCTVNRPLHESLLLWFEHISQRVCMGNSKPSTTRLRGGGSTSMDGLMPIIKEHEAGSSVSCPCLHFILPPWEATVRRPLPDASPSVLDVSASRTVSQ